jgi:nucleoside-diphosphate-sugar epimerase
MEDREGRDSRRAQVGHRMNILITGSEGYIGSVLSAYLIERDHTVTGLDTGYYREGWLFHPQYPKSAACISKDIRRITEEDLVSFDAIVHLAELSNDPLGQQNPALTYSINHEGTVALAQKCIKAGITRFVYTSSCSVYGTGTGEFKDEQSELLPQTAYAACKTLVERDLTAMASDDFSPTFLRNATAYGASPHMRFDLVLNNLAGFAWTAKQIRMTSDGTPWRPLVHVRDIAQAITCTLEAPRMVVHKQILNVGATEENYQIRDIARIVANTFPECDVTFGNSDGDNRSYRVRCDKIRTILPSFQCQYTASDGAYELFELFQRIRMPSQIFNFRPYTRLNQLRYLLETGQIDDQFYWTASHFGQPVPRSLTTSKAQYVNR